MNLSNRLFAGTIETGKAAGYRDIPPDVGPPQPPDAPPTESTRPSPPVDMPAVKLDTWGYSIFQRKLRLQTNFRIKGALSLHVRTEER